MIEYSSEILVDEIVHCGGDDMITSAALVLMKDEPLPSDKSEKLLPYLMKHWHGTSFKSSCRHIFNYPQYEIEVAARRLEMLLAEYWPITYKAFCDNGRVAS